MTFPATEASKFTNVFHPAISIVDGQPVVVVPQPGGGGAGGDQAAAAAAGGAQFITLVTEVGGGGAPGILRVNPPVEVLSSCY